MSQQALTVGDSSAVISDDGLYRYLLTRRWQEQGSMVLWVMLNPSTADAHKDDATIRSCRRFSRQWGWAGLVVVNLYALRATRPTHLMHHPDPVGRENEQMVRTWLAARHQAPLAVAAWGASAPLVAEAGMPDMVERVTDWARAARRQLWSLGRTREGQPRHPLYLPGDSALEAWPPVEQVEA